ncbi:MAG: SDR family NAD(P)-dependent oxidoreductase [Planctomycetes bacterium]|nr:SDR family NAD(P)-dependent oxidoreductase [Planctomycetota bacterium]
MPKNDDKSGAKMTLTDVLPVLRGLLAEPTGTQDVPYEPVILKSLIGPEAIDFAAGPLETPGPLGGLAEGCRGPVLHVDSMDAADTAQEIRQQLGGLLDEYQKANDAGPEVIAIKGMGAIIVDKAAGDGDGPLKNRVALVTGAAGAIGYGICKALLDNGCYVAASDLPGKKLDSFTEDLRELCPERVCGCSLDVTDEGSVKAGFGEAIRKWGGVDIVVINAGLGHVCTLDKMQLADFQRLERVNVDGTLLTIAEASRQLIAQATGGDIIIISTKNVPSPSAGFGAYSATKAACHQLGRIASIEMAPHGVRVNMVAPDAVFTGGKYKSGFWEEVGANRMKARGLDEEGLQQYYRSRNLLKAAITGRHVGNAVLFFVTHQTPTTGATIPVDGGLPDATPR